MIGRPKLVLASGSPRRLALINQAAINIELWTGLKPDKAVMLKALQEARAEQTKKHRACLRVDRIVTTHSNQSRYHSRVSQKTLAVNFIPRQKEAHQLRNKQTARTRKAVRWLLK